MTAVLFVVFLLVVAGLVSAAGDRMGHLAARRKIRFGKMRPRNVSTTIAVLTGLSISLVTFLILFALWKDFRDALTQHQQVRQELATVQRQLSQASTNLRVAQEQTQQAVDDKTLAVQELAELQTEVTNLRGQVTTAAMELDQSNQVIAQREREVSELTVRRNELQEEVTSLEGWAFKIMSEYGQQMSRLKEFEEGEIVYPRGAYLYYLTVPPTEVNALQENLMQALDELGMMLNTQGLSLSENTAAQVESFVDTYAHGTNPNGAVVVFSTAQNVIRGGEMALELKAVPLTALVKNGEEIMTVLVQDREASISWLGTGIGTVEIASKFDEAAFATFIEQLWAIFILQSADMGFLPDLATGEIPNPVDRLVSIYDDLAVRERPFILQIVAGSPANPLDGLDDCDIYVSKWPPEN